MGSGHKKRAAATAPGAGRRVLCRAALLLAGLLLFSGCSRLLEFFQPAEHLTPEDRLEALCGAIDARDRDATRGLFSKQALRDTADIEAGIDHLFSLVKGEITGMEKTAESGGSQTDTGIYDTRAWCDITTTEGSYAVFMLICDNYPSNRDRVGLYVLRVVAYDENYA